MKSLLHLLRYRFLAFVVLATEAVFLTSEALAQEPGTPAPRQPGLLDMLPLFLIVFFIFYFLVIRPNDKRLREQQALVAGLKKGDQVVTTSGIIGRVAGTEEDHVLLEVANNVRIRFERAAIVKLYQKDGSDKKEPGQKKSAAA